MRTSVSARRGGFTLVELLVVIVIIGILAGLITAAVWQARPAAIDARIRMEIGQLDIALNAYKEKYGDYPPDMTDPAAVQRHVARAFPRYTGDFQQIEQQINDALSAGNAGYTFADLAATPGAALVFWLGGIPVANPNASKPKLAGFSANPRNPFQLNFDADGDLVGRTDPLFEFDRERLELVESPLNPDAEVWMYTADTGSTPSLYVYFKARGNRYEPDNQDAPQLWTVAYNDGSQETVQPYYDARLGDWCSPKSYQIICAGLDGRFGTTTNDAPPRFPIGDNYAEAHYDNLTSFSQGRLEDEMP